MKKIKPFLFVFIICVLFVTGYRWFAANHSTTDSQQQAEVPRLAEPSLGESIDEGTDSSGGQLEGKIDDVEPDAEDEQGGQAVYSSGMDGAMAVVAQPESITVLVNPFNKLPEEYAPEDLVFPDVRFIFTEMIDKRKLRKEAAEALEKMFQAAEEDGIWLAGVSAYRSHATQKQLFNRYVEKDGLEKARTYSAYPGTSEHEMGLAIDVTSSDGKCAAADCFGDTKEAAWLDEHSTEYGFIIRYPKGKESITGYKYEPWHLRYVGMELAAELAASGETLEEYYNAVPVSN